MRKKVKNANGITIILLLVIIVIVLILGVIVANVFLYEMGLLRQETQTANVLNNTTQVNEYTNQE